MPYIVTTAYYPSDKLPEVAERYFETLKKFPPDDSLGNEVVPVAAITGQQGVEAMTILQVKEGKLEAALERSQKAMFMYRDILGVEFSIRVYLTVEEGLAGAGISLPK